MPRLFRILLVAILAGGGAFLLTRQLTPSPSQANDEIAWLTQEFALTSQQAAQVAALHAAYRPICDAHCTAILETRAELESTPAGPAHLKLQQRMDELTANCHQSTQEHLVAVAAVMEPSQGERYLALISPRLSVHQHAEPFGLK